ncbi:MAG: c-type cytochrome [Verrucomicrobia bacterium]|nr:c-type cytochrome [Verrucomicrobiota bacterium]
MARHKILRLLLLMLVAVSPLVSARAQSAAGANRLTYLDERDPFYVHLNFPKLTAPQWVGEPDVEAVVILAIDDLREPKKYEAYLRPILDRLKQIDGRAPLSIFCNALDHDQAQFREWLKEGLSLEVHTLSHPCPLLAKGNFKAAVDTVHGGIELLNRIPNNRATAYRMPCCDSINSPSPRFYSEIFSRANSSGQFLTIDSSVMNITTSRDTGLPREWVVDANGQEKFRKYVPFSSFVTTIDDYPYPYVIGKLCWEFPAMAPSDWEAQRLHGTNNPVTVADWKIALDAAVLKQGTFTFIFHPHGWIRAAQIVEFIDYSAQKHGRKVKFLNFREAQQRLDAHLLAGQPIRAASGQDNGVRLVDLDHDGYLDVIIGNERTQKTRIWDAKQSRWNESECPARLTVADSRGNRRETGVRIGILGEGGQPVMLVMNEEVRNAWRFENGKWLEDKALLRGLEIEGQPVLTNREGLDRGVHLRDVNSDGNCELVVGNDAQNAVFSWEPKERYWKKLAFGLPKGTSIVDARGRDNGLRFADINDDGYADAIFSNDRAFSVHLFVPKLFLGFQAGWTREVSSGKRGDPGEIPMIVRGGDFPDNGAWFHSRHLWVQNEDTASLKDLVDRRSYDELLAGLQPPAKSPKASLESMQLRPGFKVELVAHEPLVMDPIAFEWGADGKLWVAEMGDYPLGADGKGRSGGVVRFLEDTDGDGVCDKSTVFLDGVNFPTGVMPWRKGVLVSAAPEIFYAEDTDGDGKADVRRTILSGFREGNQQHRVNGFEFGLDNWIYCANGDSGGDIRSASGGKTLVLRGHDLRFRPDDGAFELVAGQTQYGRHRDDWGNWFGDNNPAWVWHYFLPEHYLARNPHLAVRTLRKYLANYPDSTRVLPASRSLQRFNDIGMLNHVTSANSPTPYRDELFGPEFESSVFISEPVHNLIHREVLEPDGVSFTSHRPSDEKDIEFLASTDNWFRPIMLKTGPDGALYIADMYRLVIEHPEWIPADTQKRFDLRAGSALGRIYRVYPEKAVLRKVPRLDDLDTAGLVKALESPNGWQRDTAQRLLVQAGDKAAEPLLRALVSNSQNPKVRLQALCTLDGLGALSPQIIAQALADDHPAIREHAVRLSEPFLNLPAAKAAGLRSETRSGRAAAQSTYQERLKAIVTRAASLQQKLLELVNDPNARVRYQLAFALGEWNDPKAGPALLNLALRDIANAEIQIAVMSSAAAHIEPMLENLLADAAASPPPQLTEELFRLAALLKKDPALAKALLRVSRLRTDQPAWWQFAGVAGFLEGAERLHGSLAQFRERCDPALRSSIQQLDAMFSAARRVAFDERSAENERAAAIRLLGRRATEANEDIESLSRLLGPLIPNALQKAALERLGRLDHRAVAEALLSGWRGYLPAMRNDVLNLLLSRSVWAELVLTAIEKEQIQPGQVGTVYQQKLLSHSQSAIRNRAQPLFATQADRKKILKQYESALGLAGKSAAGAELFRQHCANCHRFRNEGFNVGPDLAALATKSPEVLLGAILDPNAAVESRYVNYTAVTKGGRELSGIIAAETPNSITLRGANGVEEAVLRSEVIDLTGSGLSLMPDGFESALKPQDLADLIAYLTNPPGT